MKTLRYILITALCFVLTFSMCSCSLLDHLVDRFFGDNTEETTTQNPDEPKKPVITDADSLFDAILQASDNTKQVDVTGKMNVKLTYMGETIGVTGTYKLISTDKDGDNPYYYTETETTVTALDETTTTTGVTAYYNGNAYVSNSEHNSYMYAPMTPEEFTDFIASDTSEEDILPEVKKASQKEYKEQKDGNWTLKFSDYSKKSLNKFLNEFAPDSDFGDMFEFVDIEWSFVADKDFRIKEMNLSFILDEDESAEGDTFTVSYTDIKYDDITLITKPFQGTQYKKVDDLKILQTIEKHFDDFEEAESGSFTSQIKATYKYAGETDTMDEYTEASFGTDQNGYYFAINMTMGSGLTLQKMTMNYKNGKCTVTVDEESYEETYTEKEAKEIVSNILGQLIVNTDAISDIKVKEINNGTQYTLTSTVSGEEVESVFEKITQATQTIIVTVADGKIISIDTTAALQGTIDTGSGYENMSISTKSIVTFS